MRDLDAAAIGDLPDCLAGDGLDLGAVEDKTDRIGHSEFLLPSLVPWLADGGPVRAETSARSGILVIRR
jgi:hypothetical protein